MRCYAAREVCRRGRRNAKLRCFCVDFGFLFCNGHALRVNVGILGLEGKCESFSKSGLKVVV
jgi:hypothetical protein